MKRPSLENNMSKSILCVRWNQSVEQAWNLMLAQKIRHLPVTDDEGIIVGVLSDRDVLRAMDQDFSVFTKESQVADYMNWPVITIDQSNSLTEVLDVMIQEKISSLIVTKDEIPTGIVTSEDMLRVLRELLLRAPDEKTSRLGDLQYIPWVQEAIREASSVGI